MYNDEDDDIPAAPAAKKAKPLDNFQLKFLQSQLAQKKNALQAASRIKMIPKPAAPSPVIDLAARNKMTAVAGVSTISKFAPSGLRPVRANPVADNISFLPKAATDDSFMMFGEYLVKNEYQVAVPNDYEKMSVARNERKAREKAAKEIAKRLAKEHKEEDRKRTKGAAIAPPQILIESQPEPEISNNDEKDEDKSLMPPPSFLPAFGKATSRGLGIAANIMKKHGYKEGQGLGKMEQGMSTALQVERSGKHTGNIVAENPKPPTFATNSFEAMKNATKILALSNLIAIDELKNDYDNYDEFGGEIKEEMEKCGQVANVIVHTEENAEEESQQVRVYVEFTNNAQAIKAFVVMNGRFFGGRSVMAGFHDVDNYNNRTF